MSGKFDVNFNLIPPSALNKPESLEDLLDKPNQKNRDAFQNSIEAGLTSTNRSDASRHYDAALNFQRELPDRYAQNTAGKQMLQDLVQLKKHILELPDTDLETPEGRGDRLAEADRGTKGPENLEDWYNKNKSGLLGDQYQVNAPGLKQVESPPRPRSKVSPVATRTTGKTISAPETNPSVTVTHREATDTISLLGARADQTVNYVRAGTPKNSADYVRNINSLGKVIQSLDKQIKLHGEGVVGNYLNDKKDRLYAVVGEQIRGIYKNHSFNEVLLALKEVDNDQWLADADQYRQSTVGGMNPKPDPTKV